MANAIKVKRHGQTLFSMEVVLETGSKERWYYQREETAHGVSYSMVEREDI